jgi:hypothetical protein
MVSGFLISPYDHDKIRSGDAKETLISSNIFGDASGLNGFVVISWFILISSN